MKRRTLQIGFTLLLLGLVPSAARAQEEGIAVGESPAAAAVEDLEGGAVSLAEVTSGRPAVVEFWATWCAICRGLEPKVKAAHARFGEDVAFVVVAVGVAQTPAQVARHVDRHEIPGTVVWDARGEAVRAFDAPGTGFVVVLDADGRVAYTGTGIDQDIEGAVARVVGDG